MMTYTSGVLARWRILSDMLEGSKASSVYAVTRLHNRLTLVAEVSLQTECLMFSVYFAISWLQ
jgi:hypothetical protein